MMSDTYTPCLVCHGCVTGGECILAPDYHKPVVPHEHEFVASFGPNCKWCGAAPNTKETTGE